MLLLQGTILPLHPAGQAVTIHLAPSSIAPRRGREEAIVCPDPALALPTALKASSLLLQEVTAPGACSDPQGSGGCASIQHARVQSVAQPSGVPETLLSLCL